MSVANYQKQLNLEKNWGTNIVAVTKSKELKRYAKNILPNYKYEKHTIKNKTDKNWERNLGTTYCLGCKDFTHTLRPQEVKLTNKVLRFLKQKHNNKK